MAGGEMITKDLPRNDPTASMEDVLSANPEIIFVGRQYPTSIVLNNAAWRDVQAVKKNKVYALPGGVFFWDGSTEGVLMMEYMAKKFYPSLFQDLDMTKEVRNYFAHFYHYNLSDLQVTQYLQGVTP
jgi:iron complex transport system substrate-binding protein